MLIRPEKLFDGTAAAAAAWALRVENGRVSGLGVSPLPGEEVLTCHLLSPGFIDIHIHGCMGHDTMHGEAHVGFMAQALPRFGSPPSSLPPWPPAWRIPAPPCPGCAGPWSAWRAPGCWAATWRGPFSTRPARVPSPASLSCPRPWRTTGRIVQGMEHAVRLMTIAPEMPGAEDLIQALSGGPALCAGHTDASCEQMARAVHLGVSQATHLFNGMNAFSHRAPGVPRRGPHPKAGAGAADRRPSAFAPHSPETGLVLQGAPGLHPDYRRHGGGGNAPTANIPWAPIRYS